MITRIKQVLAKAGVAHGDAERLAPLVLAAPQGTIDQAELDEAEEVQLALLTAIVAVTNTRQFGEALQCLLRFVGAQQQALSDYHGGCFWHVKGLVTWRLGTPEEALPPTLQALNRSVALLEGLTDPCAQAYLPRVFDTLGQVLQHQGLLHEARLEFARALELRQALDDPHGEATTRGNLGRLQMELGDFAAAATDLAQDLALVEQHALEKTRLRAQLLSHLGTCAVEQGAGHRARAYFLQSAQLAQADQDAYGLAFAMVGLGRAALQLPDLAEAEQQAAAALAHLTAAEGTLVDHEGIAEGIRGFIHQLTAELHLARHEAPQAVAAFEAALACFVRTRRISVVEMARLRYGYARACQANGEGQRAAQLLREALKELDAATAEPLQQAIEALLGQDFPESWLLHSVSRFIGQQYMDFLLEHTGPRAFQGERQNVVILFCDLRDFTTLSEQFAATPEVFVATLNDYLRYMTRCVEHCQGIVCQVSGDGMMAVFSLPTPRPMTDAQQAVRATLMMREELVRFCRTLPQDIPSFRMGVGLHAGPVMVGLYGSALKRLYTVNGDAVNTAARLEGLTKFLGASILISNDVAHRLPPTHPFLLRPLGRYRVKGRTAVIDVADLMGEDDGSRAAQALKAEIVQVREAVALLQGRQFVQADTAFTALATLAEEQGNEPRAQGYRFLANAAKNYRTTPPAADWDGAITMEEK